AAVEARGPRILRVARATGLRLRAGEVLDEVLAVAAVRDVRHRIARVRAGEVAELLLRDEAVPRARLVGRRAGLRRDVARVALRAQDVGGVADEEVLVPRHARDRIHHAAVVAVAPVGGGRAAALDDVVAVAIGHAFRAGGAVKPRRQRLPRALQRLRH